MMIFNVTIAGRDNLCLLLPALVKVTQTQKPWEQIKEINFQMLGEFLLKKEAVDNRGYSLKVLSKLNDKRSSKNKRDRFTTHAALETAIELSLFIML